MEKETVAAILADWRGAPIGEPLRAMLGFLEKLTRTPENVTAADIAPLHQVGLSDEAIMEAMYVCFVFSIINRLADAFDFEIPTEAPLQNQAKFLYAMGYSSGVLPI